MWQSPFIEKTKRYYFVKIDKYVYFMQQPLHAFEDEREIAKFWTEPLR